MAQAYAVGWTATDPELKTSVKGTPYLRFSFAERIGYGESVHTQYIQVWAWGGMTQQLINAGVRKGSLIWVSGSIELEEYTRKDGVTKDKRLKLKLKEWGLAPTAQRQRQDLRQVEDVPSPEIINGDRDTLPE